MTLSKILNNIRNKSHLLPLLTGRGLGGGAVLCSGALYLLLAYLSLMLTRVAYLLVNWSTFSNIFADNSVWTLLRGCLVFDTSALMYTNSIIVLMTLLSPVFGVWWRRVTHWLFVIINGVMVVMNLGDAVYFKYTGRRTTMSVFSEFQNENNLTKVFATEIVNHWYLFIFGVAVIYALHRISKRCCHPQPAKSVLRALPEIIIPLVVFIPLCIGGIRGGFTTAVRPITISNASQYVAHPQEAALILNTPFSLIRTIGKSVFHDPGYFTDAELAAIYSPLHNASQDRSHSVEQEGRGSQQDRSRSVEQEGPRSQRFSAGHKNIVILIVESFGREYMGGYNDHLGTGYKGYTPFIDSLLPECLTFDYTFANGRKSIDGMPSILSAIPHFVEPFFLTPASVNDVSGIAGELGTVGYHSAFFHGAENGSMGFEAFAKASGFKEYYGRTEFNGDKRFGGDADFDGTWAIWDEPFLQFYAQKMTDFHEPFVTAVFTASSHHPYVVPDKYKDIYKDDAAPCLQTGGTNPIHKCIQYTDMALRRFFETARRQPWYKNTIFVLTSDHTNIYDHAEYATDLGLFGAPILFFDPSGEMPRGRRHCIAQQTDIMPTLLSYVGYQQPYIAWGIDLLSTPDEDTWAVSHSNGTYQFVKGDYLLQFDGQRLTAIYNYKKDWMLCHNLLDKLRGDSKVKAYERQLKGIIQSYMQRMVNNQLMPHPASPKGRSI